MAMSKQAKVAINVASGVVGALAAASPAFAGFAPWAVPVLAGLNVILHAFDDPPAAQPPAPLSNS